MEEKVIARAQGSERVGRLQARQSHLKGPAGTLLQPPAGPGLGAEKHCQRHIRDAFQRPSLLCRPSTQICCGKPWGAGRKSLGEHGGNRTRQEK